MYLSGAYRPELVGLDRIGFMLTPNIGNAHPSGSPWAADSGLFSKKGARTFDLDKYLRWLQVRSVHQKDCLFVTAPDVVGNWEATVERSAPVLPLLRELGYPAALVGQDGLRDPSQLEWDTFDCLFIGGTDDFKLADSTYQLVAEAKNRGKYCHMGRVNSQRRFMAAYQGGYDSVDGTFIAFGPHINIPRLLRWFDHMDSQTVLQESDCG